LNKKPIINFLLRKQKVKFVMKKKFDVEFLEEAQKFLESYGYD
jgi:hypothetical protein